MLDADQPVTAPVGPDDPRTRQFQANAFQISQGGRIFIWNGCGACHGAGATGPLDLSDRTWRHGSSGDRVYAAISNHGSLGARILPEQKWQLAAYVQQLPTLDPAYRRRQDVDGAGEPQGASWKGAVR